MKMVGEYKNIADSLRERLLEKRYKHTLSVLKCAQKMAEIYDVDFDQATLAALLHDCGRVVPIGEQVDFASKNNIPLDEIELKNIILIHAKLGAFIAEKEYGIGDGEVLEAIAYHTTACVGMSNLAMLIYVADMLEDTRDFPGVNKLRAQIGVAELPKLMLACLTSTIKNLLEENRLLHPNSIRAYNELVLR